MIYNKDPLCTIKKSEATLLTALIIIFIIIVSLFSYAAGYRACIAHYGLQFQKGSLADLVHTKTHGFWKSYFSEDRDNLC